MDYKKRVAFCLVAASFIGLTALGRPQNRRSTSVNARTVNGQPITDCRDLNVEFSGRPAITAEEQQSIPRQSVASVNVLAPTNGGVYVTGWNRDEYLVKTCKAADPDDGPGVLGGISTSTAGGRVVVDGPSNDDWIAYILIQAPAGSVLNLETANGPIAIAGVSGRVQARATNGPIALRDFDGQADIQTQNGPITLEGGRGNHRLVAANGPIHVELTGSRWEGAGLDARTQNGPLSLELPTIYQSAVRIDVSSRSPVRCVASQCSQAMRGWAEPDRIDLGTGNPVVHLSTVNGPVTIGSTR